MTIISRISNNIHELQLIRRIAFFWMMYITTISYMWAMDYVTSVDEVSSSTALIVGAVLGPVSTLQGAVIQFYAKHPYRHSIKREDDDSQ